MKEKAWNPKRSLNSFLMIGLTILGLILQKFVSFLKLLMSLNEISKS